MAPPPVTIYVTSLTSTPKVRHHIDLLHRGLRGLEIPYEAYDLVIDEDAKKRWQRAKPPGKVIGLPGYLVGGEWVGTMDDFEEAVETGTLPQFLRQDQDYDLSAPGNTSGTVAEAELEKLMREMSEGDLDVLAGEIGVKPSDTKIGLLNSSPAPLADGDATASASADALAQDTTALGSSKLAPAAATPPIVASPAPVPASSIPLATASAGTSHVSPIGSPHIATAGTSRTQARKMSSSTIDLPRSSFDRGSRVSLEEKADLAREMMEAGTVDGLMKAVEKAEKMD